MQFRNVEDKLVRDVVLVGNVTDVKLRQPLNVACIEVKLFIVAGNTTEGRLAQPANAFSNVVTEFKLVGIVIDFNTEQLRNVWFILPILFWALFGKTAVFKL